MLLGKRLIEMDLSSCPKCKAPCRWMEMRALVNRIGKCPLCEEEIDVDNVILNVSLL